MVDLVNREPAGLGEMILLQDADSMFRNWKRVAYEIRPDIAWGALAHLEASGLHRPGDAPVVWALGQSQIPAGSQTATDVYARTHQTANITGNAWDAPGTVETPAAPRRSDYADPDEYFRAVREFWKQGPIQSKGVDYENTQAMVEAGLIEAPQVPEDDFALFDVVKGASRWLMLGLDAVPEGFDAVARAAVLVKSGDLTIGEAVGGMFGGEAAHQVGIPLFQYLGSAWAGERLNMGTGWFAQGEIAQDVAVQLDMYDTETHGIMDEEGKRHGGLTQADFNRMAAREGGALVQGLGGKVYRANNLEEWKFLRDNVGRAALLETLVPKSAEQQALGVAHGTFQEAIYDEATVVRQPTSGQYFVQGTGKGLAAGVGLTPETFAFDAVSGTLDFGKNLIDLPVFKAIKGGAHLVSAAGRFVGLGGEAGKLATGTNTAVKIVEGADLGAFDRALDDLTGGNLNFDMAVNAVARQADEPLTAANSTVGALRNRAAQASAQARADEIARLRNNGIKRSVAENMAPKEATAAQIDALVRRAANGDAPAVAWATKILTGTDSALDDVTPALENLRTVTARAPEVDLVAGVYGKAQVAEDVLSVARKDVEELQKLMADGKAWAIPDPTNGKVMLTFDADLGRASSTLSILRKSAGDEPKGQKLITNLFNEHWATRRWAEKQVAARYATVADEVHTAPTAWIKTLENPGQRAREITGTFPTNPQARLFDASIPSGRGNRVGRTQFRDDIAAKGVQQPLEIGIDPNGHGILLEGHHRLQAALDLGITDLPVVFHPGLNPWLAHGGGRNLGEFLDPVKMAKARKTKDYLQLRADEVFNVLPWKGVDDAANTRAADDVANLIRVVKRSDGENLLLDGASAVSPKIDPKRLADMLSGEGKARDLVESLTAANTIDEVMAILGPTVENAGRIPPAIISHLARATTEGEVTEVFLRLAGGQRILPQRMALLGNAARFANLSTVGGMSVGAIAGAAEGDNPMDILGGAISGAVIGAMGGSGLGSTLGYMFGNSTRKIEDVADAMDLMLAGTRSTTADFLRSNGVDMGRAQDGLSIPSQLKYAYGASPLGRRIARSAETNMNLNDPTDIFYKLADYARSLGVKLNEEIQVFTKFLSDGETVVRKVVKSSFKTADEMNAHIGELAKEGFVRTETLRMDDVMQNASGLLANNPAQGYVVLREFGKVVDAHLADQGLPAEFRSMITSFTESSGTEFLGTIDAMGRPAAHMQYVVNGRVRDGSLGARIESELWSGHIQLPPPEKVQRAINQLDMLGRTTQLFTGEGVLGQLSSNLMNVAGGNGWTKITPELERNAAMRTARAITASGWATVVLLGRPFAFISRVLGEDQARMAASSMPNVFTHPFSYLSYVAANFDMFRRMGAVKGVASRSIIPDDIVGSGGKVNTDVLDNMTHWELSEDARHAMNIYDRRLANERMMFGTRSWTTTHRGSQLYLDYLTGEIRQLVSDPMLRHMARTKANNAVDDTYRWLTSTSQGNRVLTDWGRQFRSAQEAEDFMEPANLKAFLWDEYARLHLKTGGDWVFKWNNSYVHAGTMSGISPEVAAAKGWDQAEDGYIILRKGDEELLDMVGTGSMKNVKLTDEAGVEYTEETLRIRDHLTDQKWEAMKARIAEKHHKFEAHSKTQKYDPDNDLRFPEAVKGSRADTLTMKEKLKLLDYYEQAVDRFYDWILGRPSRVFSRQPVFGAYYWERMGMLYPSMDQPTQAAFRAIAEKEGTWRAMRRVARETENSGAAAKNTITDVGLADLNAKAYSVERTRDILFDLHRQRNFVDGLRIILPFAGPFVEALEAWGRVIKNEPLTVWRRGTQLVQHTWNTSGIGDQPDPFGQGWFYVDPETGDEMFNYPWLGKALPSWLNKGARPGAADELGGRARGLNIVFGTEDLAEPGLPNVLGVPISALNPGVGPVLQVTVAPFLKDREGMAKEIYDELFPFGTPENPSALLPYNLRKLFEGNLGEDSQHELVRHTIEQFGIMAANGEVGEGDQFKFNVLVPGQVDAAMAEARQRGISSNWFEALARSILPTLTTPEALVQIKEAGEHGVDTERLITLGALADEARDLLSEEKAEWWTTPDGFRVSTEGDWEVITNYLNEKYGMDMFSAEFLSLPLTDRPYPLVFTEQGADWVRSRAQVVNDLKSTGPLLMPDFAVAKNLEDEEYSHEAFESATDAGLARWFTVDEHELEIESRLLKAANRQVEIRAIEIFGDDSELSTADADQKARWIRTEKEANAARYAAGSISDSEAEMVRKELRGWVNIEWDKYGLAPEELATVEAVTWYLSVLDQANNVGLANGLRDITLKGAGEDEQGVAQALRADVIDLVNTQINFGIDNGTDMGNFVYIWETFLKSELEEPSEAFDQLEAVASVQSLGIESWFEKGGG